MGQHTLRRATGISASTGRAIFTGAAALALVTGGTGVAFAGDAGTSASHTDEHTDEHADDEGDHDDEHEDDKHGDDEDEKPEACEIPVVADANKATDELVNDLTDDATKPANDAAAAAAAPIDAAICAELSPELYEIDELAGHGPEDDYEKHGESPSGLSDPSEGTPEVVH